MAHSKKIEKLNKKEKGLQSPELVEKQHQKGKLSARERIKLLLDPGSFVEIDAFVESRLNRLGMEKKKFPGDAVITGWGQIDERQVYIYSQDFSKIGGSLGEMHGRKVVKVIDLARKTGYPVVGVIDSGGARIQEGIFSLDGYASIFRAMVKASGVIPQISVVVGPSAGGASYAPGLSDFILMVEGISQMYITGPKVIKEVTGEEVSLEKLGGSNVHSSKSGCCHLSFDSEESCFEGVKKLLSYLPSNNLEDPPRKRDLIAELLEKEENPRLLAIVPEEEKKSYEVKEVIREVFDKDSFLEIQPYFAPNAVIGLARLGGLVTGVVANQSKSMAGTLDIDSSDKISRFVRFCDAFNIPLMNFVDTPGYLPGTDQEERGIIRHGAKVLYAFAEATVPKISLILRKAFGGAYIALASRELGYDFVLAWPSAQIAVMGPEQAVKIIYRRQLDKSENPEKLERGKIQELKKSFLTPYQAAKAGQVDRIIRPQETRITLMKCLSSLVNKRERKISRKHGNSPL